MMLTKNMNQRTQLPRITFETSYWDNSKFIVHNIKLTQYHLKGYLWDFSNFVYPYKYEISYYIYRIALNSSPSSNNRPP